MSLINIVNMDVLDNPTNFQSPLRFEITFECTSSLPPYQNEDGSLSQDIEWKVVYVGSAENSSHDQVLDEITVGPIPVGINKFILQTDPPNPKDISERDILGITVILVTCSYRDEEFARVGYYVNNEYRPFEGYDETLHGSPPSPIDLAKVCRTILADKPRVTMFPISWTVGEDDSPEASDVEIPWSLEESQDYQQPYFDAAYDGLTPMTIMTD